MTSPLAVAGVTASLKNLLNEGFLQLDLSSIGSFAVTALPPDRVETGQAEPNQLNLFLYQVTPNLGWRNAGLPTVDGNGAAAGRAPLALDLHYLLTAYGSKDLNAEVLLGHAISLFHDNPVLTRAQLRVALGPPSPLGNLSALDLADQIELVKLTPVFLTTEDLSKLWTATQARYRTTMAYMASVVLIQTGPGGPVAAPVLTQGKDDRGPFAVGSRGPALGSVRSAAAERVPAVRLGDDLVLTGTNLFDPAQLTAVFESPETGIHRELAVTAGVPGSTLTAHLPAVAEDAAAMEQWAPGVYAVSLRAAGGAVLPPLSTPPVAVAIAPLITVSPLDAAAGTVALTLTCTPRLRDEQRSQAVLIFGSRRVEPDTVTNPADPTQPTELTFSIPDVVPDEYLVRLRVKDVDSLPITLSGSPAQLAFDPDQKVTVT